MIIGTDNPIEEVARSDPKAVEVVEVDSHIEGPEGVDD